MCKFWQITGRPVLDSSSLACRMWIRISAQVLAMAAKDIDSHKSTATAGKGPKLKLKHSLVT